jgi:hypothetical protein
MISGGGRPPTFAQRHTGKLAECLVAHAIGVTDPPTDACAWYDLTHPTTRDTIEVRSSAFLQTDGGGYLPPLYDPAFKIAPTQLHDPKLRKYAGPRRRWPAVYVFALLAHTDRAIVDPLNVAQWKFYVVPTASLDARSLTQKVIGLAPMKKLAGDPVGYAALADALTTWRKERAA